jgi:catechol 2,3-dioxygenase-like lactoylglutathione lyase family enzyme
MYLGAAIRRQAPRRLSMILQLNHFNMTVTDLERSVDFYQRAFGFEIDRRFETTSPNIAHLSSFDQVDLKMAILTLGTTRMGMLQYASPVSTTDVRLGLHDIGACQLVFAVDDVQAEYKRLLEMGVKFKSEPITDAQARIIAAQLFDPDGVTAEIVERI